MLRIVFAFLMATAVVPAAHGGQSGAPDIPEQATVNETYSNLLRRINVPQDEATYGKFYDYGYDSTRSYAGHDKLPDGYWVYVAPDWFIWKESTKAVAGSPLPPAATIDGPEEADLLRKMPGTVVTSDGFEIVATSLPTLERKVVRQLWKPDEEYYPTVHAISGPDDLGRIAYIEDYFFVKSEQEYRHLLKTVQVDGSSDVEIFSRPGSVMWALSAAGNGEIGSHVTLAPTGGRVAFLSQGEPRQMTRALLYVGRIEIWDVLSKSGHATAVMALDEPMSWFPDGKRLAFTKLVARNELPEDALGIEHFGTYFGEEWEEVPAIFVLDVESGKTTFFHVGWRALVYSDGKSVMVGGWGEADYSWRKVAIDGNASVPITAPGQAHDMIAASGDHLLYWGLPTTGSPVKYTENNSALVGPKLMLTIKIANAKTQAFQTVIPYIDPRGLVSYGSYRLATE